MKHSIFLFLFAIGITAATAESVTVWFGTGGRESKGIYRSQLNLDNGKMQRAELAAEVGGPGFLAWHPNGKVLYAVCGTPSGPGVAAYARSEDESLTLLNTQPIGDGGGTHLAVDATGKALVTAQYGGGSVALFPLQADGRIGPRAALIEHEGGARVVGKRQDSPHPHWCGFDPGNKFLFVPDLGLDAVKIYKFDPAGPTLTPHGAGKVPPGGGPRHMKFSSDGKFVYVLNELALSVTVFRYDAKGGTMTAIQTIKTLPDAVKEREIFNSASEIRVHPSGKFVYSANRGNDTVTAFRVDDATGKLSLIEVEPIRGGWPRNFNIDPSGKWLLAAGRDSNTIAAFEIDQGSGELKYMRQMVSVPGPICVLFAK